MEMSKSKVTLCAVLSLCFVGLLILIWGAIEFRNSGQFKNRNSNGNLLKTSETSLTDQFQVQVQVSSSPAPNGDPDSDPQSIKSCTVAMQILPSPRSARQWIYPHRNTTKMEVLCDFNVDGGGWTVIQKRSSGPEQEFSRNWTEYSKGFGSLDRNFWLGLENIHALTKNGNQELRIQLEDFAGNKAYAKYLNFSISDASDFYRLSIGGFDGNSTAGDSMTNSAFGSENSANRMRFSTKDKDKDLFIQGSCVELWGSGAWWFNNCGVRSHLNGAYRQEGEDFLFGEGIRWHSWKEWKSLAKAEMKIRKRKPDSKSE